MVSVHRCQMFRVKLFSAVNNYESVLVLLQLESFNKLINFFS